MAESSSSTPRIAIELLPAVSTAIAPSSWIDPILQVRDGTFKTPF
jgi:hypothetical protein